MNLDAQRKSLFVQQVDASRRGTSASGNLSRKSISANTMINIPQSLLDSSKVNHSYPHSKSIVLFSKGNVQAEYQQKGEDEDLILTEPPPRKDYLKKALVNRLFISIEILILLHIGIGGKKLSSIKIRSTLSCFRHQFSHVILQGK